jgi:hypothetical protein
MAITIIGITKKKLDLELSNCSTSEKGENPQPITPIGHAIDHALLSNQTNMK